MNISDRGLGSAASSESDTADSVCNCQFVLVRTCIALCSCDVDSHKRCSSYHVKVSTNCGCEHHGRKTQCEQARIDLKKSMSLCFPIRADALLMRSHTIKSVFSQMLGCHWQFALWGSIGDFFIFASEYNISRFFQIN